MRQLERFAEAGVQHLIIEPVSSDVDDFLDQITRFAGDFIDDTRREPTNEKDV